MTPPVRTDGAHVPQTAQGARGHVVIERTPAGWTVYGNGDITLWYDAALSTPQEVGGLARRLRDLGYVVTMDRSGKEGRNDTDRYDS